MQDVILEILPHRNYIFAKKTTVCVGKNNFIYNTSLQVKTLSVQLKIQKLFVFVFLFFVFLKQYFLGTLKDPGIIKLSELIFTDPDRLR